MRRLFLAAALLVAVAGLSGSACREAAPKAASSASSLSAALPAMQGAYARIELTEGGISFEVPAGWAQDAAERVWRPGGNRPGRLGVNTVALSPGFQSRAMLPNHAEITGEVPVDLGWATGTAYTLNVSGSALAGGKPVSAERHVLVSPDGKRLFDFYIAAPDGVDQTEIRAALDHLLHSVVVRGGRPAPANVPLSPAPGRFGSLS